MHITKWRRKQARIKALGQANNARDTRNPARAAELYQVVIDRWGPHFGILVQLGNALKDSGAYDRAKEVYHAALRIEPENADCHLQLGHLMKLSGDPDRAQQYYIEANRLDPALEGPLIELRAIEARRVGMMEAAVPGTARDAGPGADALARLPVVYHYARTSAVHQRLVANYKRRRI